MILYREDHTVLVLYDDSLFYSFSFRIFWTVVIFRVAAELRFLSVV